MAEYLSGGRIQGSTVGNNTTAPTASTVSSDKVLSFTGNGTFTPTSNMTVRYLAIGGGGGGGNANGGGGGAGAFRTSTSLSLTGGTAYTIAIGIGGIGAIAENAAPTAAGDTSISGSGLTTITSSAGGYGGFNDYSGSNHGGNSSGGSGGGAGHSGGSPNGGTSGAYGNDGGDSGNNNGAGGGGADTAGADSGSNAGNGGNGLQSDITGSNVYYSAGGGGAAQDNSAGSGGTSGGGAGATSGNGGDATTYGSGGGGGMGASNKGGDGKAGIVILRFASSGAYSSSMGIHDEKTAITNVPVGTRYEETDTRKIFRRTGTAPQHLGWTEKGTSGTSSLIAWFDATDTSTITKDGSNLVSVWADKMGTSAYNLAQATSGDKPTWVDDDRNGRDVISFGAPSGAYMQTDFGLTLAQPYTIVTAWVFAANDSSERVGYDSNDSSNRAIFIKNSTASSWRIHAGADLSFTDATIPANWGYSVGVFNGASSEIRINGSSAATGNAGSDSFTPMTLGSDRNAGTPWEQKIMHVLIYNKALSSGEIAELETWLDSEVNP